MKLEVRNLKKTYGTVQALKGINYTFTPGVYGILGANGAGKSTMINLITDNVSRDKMNGGSILFGEDSAEEDILKLGKQFRGLVGYMPQQQGFYEIFRLKHFLNIWQRLRGLRRLRLLMTMAMMLLRRSTSRFMNCLRLLILLRLHIRRLEDFQEE
ncbi:MAG: ATP-binding cassette domain-containing protein [Lachnospira eligens]